MQKKHGEAIKAGQEAKTGKLAFNAQICLCKVMSSHHDTDILLFTS